MSDYLDIIKTSLEILEDILSYAYEGYVLVDSEGKIVKFNYEKLMGIKEDYAVGQHVVDVIENTRMHIVVKTGESELQYVQRIQGHDMITNRVPIIEDGKVVGAFGVVLYKDVSEVKELAHHLLDLQSKINKYKDEINRIEKTKHSFQSITTRNSKMLYLIKIGEKSAETNSTVLITGESGTGKEVFAHAIHRAGYRKDGPFVAINCSAIPRELLESELFGYEEGAFTGARKKGKLGKFHLANGGTLFLDEIGTMPLDMQVKLLRVLEEKEFEPVGGTEKVFLDARIIAATNENLEEEMLKGRFREDLFYRLNVISIEIPPLRKRVEDIFILAEDLLKSLIKELDSDEKVLDIDTIKLLEQYHWPGNVRELRNVLERAINLVDGYIIRPEHLPSHIRKDKDKNKLKTNNLDGLLLKNVVAKAEIETIKKALTKSNGNRTQAAKILGIHRTALYKKLNSYGIDIEDL